MTDEERKHAIKSGKITVHLFEEKTIHFDLEQGEVVMENDDLEPGLTHEMTIDYTDLPNTSSFGCKSETYMNVFAEGTPRCIQTLWDKLADHYLHEED